ncbi:MAG: TIGR00341 family protein [Kordiimonas sp.]|nr:TIGR00341 family protein [Kordiimonas sp.]
MTHRVIQIHLSRTASRNALRFARMQRVIDYWPVGDDNRDWSLLVRTKHVQSVTDKLQTIYSAAQMRRLVVLPVEAVIPKPPDLKKKDLEVSDHEGRQVKPKGIFEGLSRDELLEDVVQGATITRTFFLLVIFSTIVASIGLIEDNIAVVIGAMVIAPLLGPNIALALATALGDVGLMMRAVKTNLLGVGLSLLLSFGIGAFWVGPLDSPELISRTDVGFDGIALALVSGAAAVLSLASGTSSVLVGVMVAVALLPPATTLGIFLGAGNYPLAEGAGLLLAVNVVCVNLAAKVTFLLKGVQPLEWYDKQKARKAMGLYLLFWILTLGVLSVVIMRRSGLLPAFIPMTS